MKAIHIRQYRRNGTENCLAPRFAFLIQITALLLKISSIKTQTGNTAGMN